MLDRWRGRRSATEKVHSDYANVARTRYNIMSKVLVELTEPAEGIE
jgi:hypothetical protein